VGLLPRTIGLNRFVVMSCRLVARAHSPPSPAGRPGARPILAPQVKLTSHPSATKSPVAMASISKRRPKFSQHEIEQQLQHAFLHLFSSVSSTSSSEIEQLGPILLNIHRSRQQDAYLKALKEFVAEKEKEIEAVCARNYQVSPPTPAMWGSPRPRDETRAWRREAGLTEWALDVRILWGQCLRCSKLGKELSHSSTVLLS